MGLKKYSIIEHINVSVAEYICIHMMWYQSKLETASNQFRLGFAAK